MKNTALYKFIYKEPFDLDFKIKTFNWTCSIFILPILAIAALALSVVQPIIILPAIVVDLYDLWYNKYGGTYEEKKRRKILKNINKELESYGKNLLKQNGVYCLRGLDSKKISNDLYDFLLAFFKGYNKEYCTEDSKTVLICGLSKRRSLGDIFLICKYYFPTCSIIDVFKTLIMLKKRNLISFSRCSDIRKIVFYSTTTSSYFNGESNVEYFGNLGESNITINDVIQNLK